MEKETIRESRKRKLSDVQLILIEHLKSAKSESPNEFPTLKGVVFQNIAKNIEYWLATPEENKDQNYASPFECLSTKDTLAILNKAIDIKYDEKRCFKLFLHRRLKAFDFSLVSPLNRIMAFKYLTQLCDGIKALFIPDPNLTSNSKGIIRFKKLTRLEHNNFVISCLGYNFLEVLSIKYKSLKSLQIPCGYIERKCYESIVECSQLQSLSLISPNNLDAGSLVKILSALPMLSSLSLYRNKIEFESLEVDLRFNNILTLDIGSSDITNEGLQVIVAVMPNITNLTIYNCFYLTSAKCFPAISKFDNLTALNTSFYTKYFDYNDDLCFAQFLTKQGEKLTSLNLSGFDRIDTRMVAKCCPNLETLHLIACSELLVSWIKKSDVDDNSSLYNHLIPFEKQTYSLLEVCHRLNTFHLSVNNYSTNQLQMLFIGNSKVLRNLNLSLFVADHEDFISKFFSKFNFKYLEKLDILLPSGTCLPKKEVYTILRNHIFLKELNLHKCSLTDEDIKDIKHVIQQSKSKVKIYFESKN